jgi:hypothetical protein
MAKDPTQLIEEWFAGRKADGDFVQYGRDYAYRFIPPARRGAPIFYTTKTNAFAAGTAKEWSDQTFGFIGRSGLPNESDVVAIRRLVGGHTLFFLGDMDPQDLLIFAWFRARIRPKRVRFLGICDRYLDQLKVVLPETFHIRCSRPERRSMTLLNSVFPDLEKVVGRTCHAVLTSGRKTELEAVVSALAGTASILPSDFK